MRLSALAWILLALALTLSCGCSDPGAVSLEQWTFEGGGRTDLVTLPVHVGDRLPSERARYKLQRTIDLGEGLRGRDLVLEIPRLEAPVTLRIDGEEEVPFEAPDPRSYRPPGPHAWHIPRRATEKGWLSAELEIDHTWDQSAWLDTVPRITAAPDGGRPFALMNLFNKATAIAAFGFMIFSAYMHFVMFLSDRRRPEFGWYAITAITGAAYPLYETGLVARFLGPQEADVLGVAGMTSLVSQTRFTAAHFHLKRPSKLWLLLWLVSTLSIVAASASYAPTALGAPAALIIVLPSLAYQIVTLFRLARMRPVPPTLVTTLGGWVIFTLCLLPDLRPWLGLGESLGGWRLACLGVLAIGVFQTATISRAHTQSLRDAEALNAELRRQIAGRSRQLAEALARIGGQGDASLEVGAVIEGRYKVAGFLGQGAGGAVYVVERMADRARFAMKVVRDAGEPGSLARLAREAELAAGLKHANVISIVDVDVSSTGLLYIVMEYVEGTDLGRERARFGDLDWALPILGQIADGLAAIHAAGIIHRDLKPSNVLLAPTLGGWHAKITDFGIARGNQEGTTRVLPPGKGAQREPQPEPAPAPSPLTMTGIIMGTPLYMAPEAIDGARNATAALDVFAFGVIAYELVVGQPPFRTSPALVQLDGGEPEPPPPVAEARPDCPDLIAELIDRCLSLDPSRRPTARDIQGSLRMVWSYQGTT